MAPAVVGIVLAAGRSSRFGPPKQLLPLGDSTLLGQVVRRVNGSSLDRVVVVLGRASDDVREAFDPGRARLVDNTAYGEGCASSLLAGLDSAGACDAVTLLLGDQPGVSSQTIDAVLDRWRLDRPWAAVTAYRDALGHPFVFAREAFAALRGLHGDKAVWKLIEAHPGRTVKIAVNAELPMDVNTEEDYRALLARWEKS